MVQVTMTVVEESTDERPEPKVTVFLLELADRDALDYVLTYVLDKHEMTIK